MSYPFVQAKWYAPSSGRTINVITLHSMEGDENGNTAEACANYFAHLPSSRKASAHYCVDDNSIVQCVQDHDIAYHAPPNGNSIGIEQAGKAAQTRDQWLDAYGNAMLDKVAELVALKCREYNIPNRFIDAAALQRGEKGITTHAEKGITTHAEVSKAFHQTDHTDPGPNYPMDVLLAKVAYNLGASPATVGGHLNLIEPAVAIISGPDGPDGKETYRILAADGGTFEFGCPFLGNAVGKMTLPGEKAIDGYASKSRGGFVIATTKGGVFTFGDFPFHGSVPGLPG